MNTRLSYLYRDSCNYKKFNEVIIAGIIEKAQLNPWLEDNVYFIPSEVGLKDLHDNPWTIYDHTWHEFRWVELTEDTPTVEIDAEQFIKSFIEASRNDWNVMEHLKHLDCL
ncbi:MAG: hypothetical protein K8R90_09150 [Candidatus Cloacimonetes bacterium]|nr:hypothetical protein [Candidatus Cloacimonadota bacterium]